MAKKKKTKMIQKGRVYIVATFNNTLITITDSKGDPVVSGSCGMYGFAGTRKSTPYAATVTVEETLRKAIKDHQLREVTVIVKGIGPGREASLRVLKNIDLNVVKLVDMTPTPHNGVRPPKIRRP